jgi:hypothetical protein
MKKSAAALLLPMIPGFVQMFMQMVSAIREDEGTPEEVKAKLDKISAELKVTAANVAAVQLPSGT